MERVPVMVSKQRVIDNEVYVSSNVALQMLGNLMSRPTLMKVAKEMNWHIAKINGKYYFRKADVSFPSWPASTAQNLIVKTLVAMGVLKDDDVDYSYYGCKKILKTLGLATTEIVTVDGHDIAVAHMGDPLFGHSALLFGVFADRCVFHEINLTPARIISEGLVSLGEREKQLVAGCEEIVASLRKDVPPLGQQDIST